MEGLHREGSVAHTGVISRIDFRVSVAVLLPPEVQRIVKLQPLFKDIPLQSRYHLSVISNFRVSIQRYVISAPIMWVAFAEYEENNNGIKDTIRKNRLSINFAMLKVVEVYISCKLIFYNL